MVRVITECDKIYNISNQIAFDFTNVNYKIIELCPVVVNEKFPFFLNRGQNSKRNKNEYLSG